jgi:hypothetical protein
VLGQTNNNSQNKDPKFLKKVHKSLKMSKITNFQGEIAQYMVKKIY